MRNRRAWLAAWVFCGACLAAPVELRAQVQDVKPCRWKKGEETLQWRAGKPFACQMKAKNTVGKVTWSVEGRPGFLNLDKDTGILSGTPTGETETYSFTVKLVDEAGGAASMPLKFKVIGEVPVITSEEGPAIESGDSEEGEEAKKGKEAKGAEETKKTPEAKEKEKPESKRPFVTLAERLGQGDWRIYGELPAEASGVEVAIDGRAVGIRSRKIENGLYTIELSRPLVKGEEVTITAVSGKTRYEPATFVVGEGQVDTREPVEATFFAGAVVDSFAGSELNNLVNADQSGDIKGRGVVGFDFAARLMGNPDVPKAPAGANYSWKDQQLWLYAETIYGTRSSEQNCGQGMAFAGCADPSDIFLLRSASSLEGFAGLRYEFLSLQRKSYTPLSLYAKGQVGFIHVAHARDDAFGVHHGAVGAIVTRGPLKGSYLEGGFGISEFFAIHPKDRWKLDLFLTHKLTDTVSFFYQFTGDADFGGGSDSFQSYIGFDFDIRELFKTFKKKEEK